MKRCLLLLAVCAVCSAAYAQSSDVAQEDVLATLAKYNPSLLEKADQNADYNLLLRQAVETFSPSGVIETEFELAALAKNFDASIALFAVSQQYAQQRLLQQMSGISLQALDEQTLAALEPLFAHMNQTTLEVRQLQLQSYRQQLKALKRNKTLDAAVRKEQETLLKDNIKSVKAEVKRLKKNVSARVTATAKEYLHTLQAQPAAVSASAAQEKELSAESAANLHIKTKHKKPVAQ